MDDGVKIGAGIAASVVIIFSGIALLATGIIGTTAFLVLIAVAVVACLAPFALLKGEWVRLGDDRIVISAPMAKLEIPFSDITSVSCERDFEFGLRAWGYGGIRRGSGDFVNKSLGDYTLAGDSGIPVMIVVSYMQGGKARRAAFNQKDETTTVALYESIRNGSGAESKPVDPEEAAKRLRSGKLAIGGIVAGSLAVTAVIIAAVMLVGSVSASLGDDSLSIDATMMHETVDYSDIVSVELRDGVSYGGRVMGLSNGIVSTGDFRNSEFGDYRLAVYKSVSSCIVVHTTDRVIVFNLDNDEKTTSFFAELQQRLPSYR